MKKPSFYLLFVFMIMIFSLSVAGEEYPLPGTDYNNIGVKAELKMELNVTLINTAPIQKFIVVNPFYNYTIYRENGEILGEIDNETYINPYLNTFNYLPGFWINPYEVLKVRINVKKNGSIIITPEDYETYFPTSVKVVYENGTTKYIIGTIDDKTNFFYETIVPQVILMPQYYFNIQSTFLGKDEFIKIIKYEGSVNLILKNIPNKDGKFNTVFVVGIPVIFEGAECYDFEPEYSTTFNEYVRKILPEYTGIQKKGKIETQPEKTFNIYRLSNNLISGRKIVKEFTSLKKLPEYDFPVWVVWLGSQDLEIKYKVYWTNSLRSERYGGGEEKKKIQIILDRRSIK